MASAQLEIISPRGDVQFVPLDPARGLVNLGRHPDNDIVLDAPGIAPFHALLDFRQHPLQWIALAPAAGANRELNHWDQLDLGGFTMIVLAEAGAPVLSAASLAASAAPLAGALAAGAALAAGGAAGAAGSAPPAARDAAPPLTGPALSREMASAVGAEGLDRYYNQIAQLPPDHADDVIIVEFTPGDYGVDSEGKALDFAVEVRQSATCQATLINGGDIVATFGVEVVGIDRTWVTIHPAEVNLNEGERAVVAITLNVPRLPSSRAGAYFFAITVTSPNYPGRSTSLGGVLLVKPFYEFTVGELSPKQQIISWRQRTGLVTVPIVNKGNGESGFRVEAEDDERGCHFEIQPPGEAVGQIRQAEVQVPANSTLDVPVRITPNRRRLVGMNRRTFAYTATVTPLNIGGGTPRSLLGQAQSAPLVGPWLIAAAVAVLLGLVVWIFWPWIRAFQVAPNNDANLVSAVQINAGDSVRLYWQASPLTELRIEPDIGKVDGPDGNLSVQPQQDTTYRLVARNFLSLLAPDLFTAEASVQVAFTRTQPSLAIELQGPFLNQAQNEATVLRGQAVTLVWEVRDATELILKTNGNPDTLAPAPGSRVVNPDKETTYVLVARNQFTGPDGVSRQVVLRVVDPTPTPVPTGTPVPAPVITRFDIQPLEVIAGEKVQISWSVTGVSVVQIRGLDGDLAPSGVLEIFPRETTNYILTANNASGQLQQLQKTVTVKPPPTGTPVPQAPKIDYFLANPTEVLQGQTADLSWSVSGDVTGVEVRAVSGSEFAVLNLDKTGVLKTSVLLLAQPVQFQLTARNGAVKSDAFVIVTVKLPPPTPTPSPTPVPPPAVSLSAFRDDTNDPIPNQSTTPGQFDFAAIVNTRIRFLWTNMAGANTTGVTILGQNLGPTGAVTTTVLRQSVQLLTLVALNSNAQPPQNQTIYTIRILPQVKVPAAPSQLVAPVLVANPGITATSGLTLTWAFAADPLAPIKNFRVYRAALGDPFTMTEMPDIASMTNIQPADRIYTDTAPSPLCGVSYYVVAVYLDLNGAALETPSSANSWQNGSCSP